MNLIDQLKASLEGERTDQRTFADAKWKGILYPELSWKIVGAAIEVHRHKGLGLIESIYERCMLRELELRSIPATTQKLIRGI